MPNGRDLRIATGESGSRNGIQIPTGWEQDIPLPNPIDRPNRANDRGIIGPHRMDSFPTTGGLEFVGHVPIVHIAQGVVPRQSNIIDDYSEVPAIFVGNPVSN